MASDDSINDRDELFKLYLRDYFIKRGMHETAEIFQKEAEVCDDSVAIDPPDGFLHEWWSFFYDVYASRQEKHEEIEPESSSKAPNITDNARGNTLPLIPQMSTSEQRTQQLQVSCSFNKTMDPPVASLLPSIMYGEEHITCLTEDADPSLHLTNANEPKFLAGTSPNHQPQDIGNQAIFRDSGIGICPGCVVTRDPMDVVQRTIKPLDGPHEPNANEGLNLVPLNGWPPKVLTSLLQAPNYQQQCQVLKTREMGELFARQIMDQITRIKELRNRQDPLQKLQFQEVERTRQTKATVSSRAGEWASQDCVNAADSKPMDESPESFLCAENEHDDYKSLPFSNLKRISATCNANKSNDFSFKEIGCLHSSKSKILCCHFSSDGKFLASAGHEKKVFLWNTETFDCVTTSEAHSLLVTDIRFCPGPGSTKFATSSFDRTVKIWDTSTPTRSLFKLTGHSDRVMSLDFHPRRVDFLCSCDSNGIIRLWNVNRCVCFHISVGASKQVRFQPRFGKFMATAIGNDINIIDVETGGVLNHLKGHVKEVLSICWDISGNCIASVSEDSARVWSVPDGKCIHELHSNGNKYQSCIFHPGYTNLLIIGGYETLELWCPTESGQTLVVPAHEGLIAGLANLPQHELVASASHDHSVKLWK